MSVYSLKNSNYDGGNVFDNFFRLHYKSLCLYAYGFVKDNDIAEDIVQEAFIRLWQAGDMQRSGPELKSFLYTIVRNNAIDWLRKQKTLAKGRKEYEILLQHETEGYRLQQMIAAEAMQEIHQAVSTLPEGCKKIFTRLFEMGEKPQQAAASLNVSVNTIKSQRARGLKLVRQKLKITSP